MVVELKKGKSSDATVGQILRYINWIEEHLAEKDQVVEGIIIAKELTKRCIPKIAEYREKAIDNPQDYARAILEVADQVRQIEREHPNTSPAEQYITAAQQQYRRDLQFAVFST